MKKIGSPPNSTSALLIRPALGDSRMKRMPTTTTVEMNVGA
jgi:hypothetical protein